MGGWRIWGQHPLRDKIELSHALLMAGIFSLASPREGLGRLWGACKVWIGLARGGGAPASRALYLRRLAVCFRCPFYSRRWGTCGSPLEKVLRQVGCHCYIPAKARYADARCWIDERTSDGDTILASFAGHGWRASGADAPGSQPRGCEGCSVTVTIASPEDVASHPTSPAGFPGQQPEEIPTERNP